MEESPWMRGNSVVGAAAELDDNDDRCRTGVGGFIEVHSLGNTVVFHDEVFGRQPVNGVAIVITNQTLEP